MELQFTFYSVGRLGPLLLTLVISVYLWYRRPYDAATQWLALYFSLLSVFNASYFFGYSWNDPSGGFAWYVACVIAFAGVARLQFAYTFPVSAFEKERKVALVLSLALATGAFLDYLIKVEPPFEPVFELHTYGAEYSSLWVPLISFLCFLWSIVMALRLAHRCWSTARKSQTRDHQSFTDFWSNQEQFRASAYLALVTTVELAVNTIYLMSRASLLESTVLAFIMNTVMLFIFGIYVLIYSSAARSRTGFMHRLVGITFVSVLTLVSFASMRTEKIFMESFHDRAVLAGQLFTRMENPREDSVQQPLFSDARNHSTNGSALHQKLLFVHQQENAPGAADFEVSEEKMRNEASPQIRFKGSDQWLIYGTHNGNSFAAASWYVNGDYLIAAYDYDFFRMKLNEAALPHVLLLFIATGLTLFLFPVFFRGSIVRPLHKLLKDLGTIKNEKDRSSQEADEILNLRAAFQEMTEMLREARKELPDFAAHLEELERVVRTEPDLIPTGNGQSLVIRSVSMRRVVAQIRKMQHLNHSVLVQGETGTGKELIARLIGAETNGPFVAVNCAAIPENLWESELFGHRRGSFTDARTDRTGRIAEAGSGTLFLDEIGELPLPIQGKLLRVLQERTFSPLGAEGETRVHCRFLFATNRDLEEMVGRGGFRQDLLYRINVFSLHLPPLRERPEDIPGLVHYLVERICKEHSLSVPEIPPESLRILMSYPWPGNIRELENSLIRALVLNESATLAADQFHQLRSPGNIAPAGSTASSRTMRFNESSIPYDEEIRNYGRSMVRRALEISGGNKTKAAEILGLKRSTLRHRMKELGLN